MAFGTSAEDPTGPWGAGGSGPDEPLLSNGSGLFEMRNRPRRDVSWLVAYLLVVVAALAGGVFAFLHRNTKFSELTSHGWSDPTLCPITATTHSARRLLQQGPDAPTPFQWDLFVRTAGAWMAASVGGALLVGLLFVWLVRASPVALVALALGLQVAVPAAMGVVALVRGVRAAGAVLLALAGLLVVLFSLWRQQIDLVARLLGLAGRGLSANPGLVPLALALQVGLVALLEVPLLVASWAAAMNGSLAFNPDRADRGAATGAEECVDAEGQEVACCVWQTEPWVPAYFALAFLAMTWSVFLAFQIKMFTVAGATAQWYFQSASAGGSRGAADSGPGRSRSRSRSRTLTSLYFAVGPSLGSLCCGAAVLTLVAMVRQALEKARKERGRNVIAACAAACLSLLLAAVEFVTRFATVRAAITGEAFLAAGHSAVALMSRNAMDAFGVWWLPPMILQSCSFLLSLSWGVVVFLTSYATTWSRQAAASPDQAAASAAITAAVALLAAWAVLGFLASLLLNVVDSLFVCFAMDRDMGQVSSLDVHAVIAKLPTVGAVVQQPDGELAYGAPPPQQPGFGGRGSAARV